MNENKRRIQVTMTNEMLDKLADLAQRFGVSSSQLAAVWIGQYLDTYDRAANALSTGIKDATSDLREP